MPRQEIIPQSDAATNKFASIEAPRTLFSIDAKVSGILTGSPTYTILVSNVYEGTFADFKEYLLINSYRNGKRNDKQYR